MREVKYLSLSNLNQDRRFVYNTMRQASVCLGSCKINYVHVHKTHVHNFNLIMQYGGNIQSILHS